MLTHFEFNLFIMKFCKNHSCLYQSGNEGNYETRFTVVSEKFEDKDLSRFIVFNDIDVDVNLINEIRNAFEIPDCVAIRLPETLVVMAEYIYDPYEECPPSYRMAMSMDILYDIIKDIHADWNFVREQIHDEIVSVKNNVESAFEKIEKQTWNDYDVVVDRKKMTVKYTMTNNRVKLRDCCFYKINDILTKKLSRFIKEPTFPGRERGKIDLSYIFE